jgi:hypothetical protein
MIVNFFIKRLLLTKSLYWPVPGRYKAANRSAGKGIKLGQDVAIGKPLHIMAQTTESFGPTPSFNPNCAGRFVLEIRNHKNSSCFIRHTL